MADLLAPAVECFTGVSDTAIDDRAVAAAVVVVIVVVAVVGIIDRYVSMLA